MELDSIVATRAEDVRRRIAEAASRAGRAPEDVRLVAVTKTFPLGHVRAAVAAGLRDLGENRIQEALAKIPATTDLSITWHLIGHVQSNKARKAAQAFPWIHAVDSVPLLRRLDQAADEMGTTPVALIQVDLAGEATKHGTPTSGLRDILSAAADCAAVRVRGLMVLPPWADDPEDARPYFRRLRALRDELRDEGIPSERLEELSMGMSHDFEVAVEEGATIVRVGTGLFGRRTP